MTFDVTFLLAANLVVLFAIWAIVVTRDSSKKSKSAR